MKQKDKPTYNGLTFDSTGEMHFYWWCEELQEKGFIKSIELQPEAFKLSDKKEVLYRLKMIKVEDKILSKPIINAHEYTPDVKITWDRRKSLDKFIFSFNSPFINFGKERIDLIKCCHKGITYIELKPEYDQNNMTRLAVLNQKWVLDKMDIFVNIIIPEKLFEKTFTPKRYITCDNSSRKRKIEYENVVFIEQFLEQ